ncbi:hypothetical protein L218DRAFT_1081237 [Marasmius fiardii PR-910]|nr:hypothetical protein L218DRAFT_1081237 [Marasmius fiardii PR-910]
MVHHFTPMKLHRSHKFFVDVVFFQVEDEIYKVPKKPFMDNPHSPFSDIFSLPPLRDAVSEITIDPEGTSEENPIVLEQVLKLDFDPFLSILLVDPPFQATILFETLTIGDWTSVLKLSTQWYFTALRKLAIHYLSKNEQFTNIDRIILARQYGVAQWFLEGIVKTACESDKEIAHTDADRLTTHTTVSLYHMKGAIRSNLSFGQKTSNLTTIFSEAFTDEFRSLEMRDLEYESMIGDSELKALQKAIPKIECRCDSRNCSLECRLIPGWSSVCRVVDGKLLFFSIV